ncbi:hypothetical protein [Rhodohalobacter mucosus]|uniref:Uncharacterized protein n=1 Tax=Rhodohalobacter mucosus TaxID=2079485 RepID=A0A316TWL3_9BACT|nr:hypothetical protein [Rhodohalobacter mucosus]PWN07779.1 hypothetical protein DDZ15_01835 [Rhodohalobacter mucosus]
MEFSKKTKAVMYGFAATAALLTAGLLFSWMNWTIIASILTIGALVINGSILGKKIMDLYNQEKMAEPSSAGMYSGIQSSFLTSARKEGSEA